jgi:hypothetical protein
MIILLAICAFFYIVVPFFVIMNWLENRDYMLFKVDLSGHIQLVGMFIVILELALLIQVLYSLNIIK